MDGYEVVACSDCGAGFADDIPPQKIFDRYYRDLSKYNHHDRAGKQFPAERLRCAQTADLMQQYVQDPDSRIVDIGCGSGALLAVLQERGFRNGLGVDPSPGCAQAAASLHGVEVMVGTISTAPQPADPYDFLILIGVMEHIRDLDMAVTQLHGLLQDGGRVFLEVPDAGRFTASADAPFQEFSVEHINFFSTRSLSNLMGLRGFQEVATGHVIRNANELTGVVAYGVYEKQPGQPMMERDDETESSIRAYVEDCRQFDAAVRAKIDSALRPGERMIVWGVGTHTLRLLATGGLNTERVSLFVDSNPNYQRQQLRGLPVVSPAALHSREPILISSRGFQREIQHQIQHEMGLENRLILLYD
jgi:SAM-dependent methyltransferase